MPNDMRAFIKISYKHLQALYPFFKKSDLIDKLFSDIFKCDKTWLVDGLVFPEIYGLLPLPLELNLNLKRAFFSLCSETLQNILQMKPSPDDFNSRYKAYIDLNQIGDFINSQL